MSALRTKLRTKFRSRDLFFHDGSTMRRVHVSTKIQVAGATAGATTLTLAMLSIAQLAVSAPAVAGAMSAAVSRDAAVARMNAKVASMEAEMATIRTAAADHAKRLEQRQAMLDAMVTGKGAMPASVPATATPASPVLGAVLAPLASAEGHQNQLAGRLAAATDARYQATASALGRLGIDASRFHQVAGAMGGPYEPMPSGGTAPAAKGQPDPAFRALFQSWKRLEQLQQGIVAIPSQRPVDAVTFTSGFGVRSDPFRGGAAMHAGVDIPGPMGTPIYATADGVVARGEWANGYGNLVELDHGKGIQTRYGHLSAILVQPGTRVTRGQLIARMGSTGRSTGSHLHYEVRLDGHAVNPMPFLQSASYLVAMQTRGNVAVGGPKGE
ncbi:peptidoglycan DD-metalloendopeptidase family protein [Sphingomonas sp. SUN039]|uniref:peptidoglycan DD-metalloendopeptidase family protein n=1 Tax=Sphingomonas sp. SUN039 TaxID=2937787 RepID=UPI0021644CD3|nr:peptidoglycan DD-metalloendopeptidase family protein [Sphingomonas sp. SUN039]UVO54441.1 peptidoglycan DD-metalloendopeptidase family protein [Sphingomonas sp. SUN039]